MKIPATFVRKNNEKPFRDHLVLNKNDPSFVVLNGYISNIYDYFDILSQPLANGTYQFKIESEDNLGNVNTGITQTVNINGIPLAPTDLSYEYLTGNTVRFYWSNPNNGLTPIYRLYSKAFESTGTFDANSTYENKQYYMETSDTEITTTVPDGMWYFYIDSVRSDDDTIKTDNRLYIYLVMPESNTIPEQVGVGSVYNVGTTYLENVSVGKVKFTFLWAYGNNADSFNIYSNNGSGDINYSTPAFSFSRINNIWQTFTTTQIHSSDEDILYKFAIKAVNSHGNESTSVTEYEILVDGVPPDNGEILMMESRF